MSEDTTYTDRLTRRSVVRTIFGGAAVYLLFSGVFAGMLGVSAGVTNIAVSLPGVLFAVGGFVFVGGVLFVAALPVLRDSGPKSAAFIGRLPWRFTLVYFVVGIIWAALKIVISTAGSGAETFLFIGITDVGQLALGAMSFYSFASRYIYIPAAARGQSAESEIAKTSLPVKLISSGIIALVAPLLLFAVSRGAADFTPVFIIGAFVPSVVALSLSLYYSAARIRALSRSLDDSMAALQRGDTASNIPYFGRDDVGILATQLREIAIRAEKLRDINHRIGGKLEDASQSLIATAIEQAASASQQASAVTETSATITEITQTSAKTAENTADIKKRTHESADILSAGAGKLNSAVGEIESLKRDVDALSSVAEELAEQARRVDSIVALVNDLAEQSSVLALNASIEAAKAGEAGRGFDAVAQEVKELAASSKDATREVRRHLNRIASLIADVSARVDTGKERTASVLGNASEAKEAIETTGENVSQVVVMADQIAAGTAQQSQGLGQVADAVAQINTSALENAAGVHKIEEISEEIRNLSSRLNELAQTDESAAAEIKRQ